jgi:hypothetical protein
MRRGSGSGNKNIPGGYNVEPPGNLRPAAPTISFAPEAARRYRIVRQGWISCGNSCAWTGWPTVQPRAFLWNSILARELMMAALNAFFNYLDGAVMHGKSHHHLSVEATNQDPTQQRFDDAV